VTRTVFEKGSPGFITEVRRQQQSHGMRHTGIAHKPLSCRCRSASAPHIRLSCKQPTTAGVLQECCSASI
jgi:hypothetical protein